MGLMMIIIMAIIIGAQIDGLRRVGRNRAWDRGRQGDTSTWPVMRCRGRRLLLGQLFTVFDDLLVVFPDDVRCTIPSRLLVMISG